MLTTGVMSALTRVSKNKYKKQQVGNIMVCRWQAFNLPLDNRLCCVTGSHDQNILCSRCDEPQSCYVSYDGSRAQRLWTVDMNECDWLTPCIH